jgi:hypothetical protein
MGNHASGRRRTKQPTFEDLERRDARDFGTRTEAMPDGGTREMGLCPECGQGAREVFRRPDSQDDGPENFACRRCLIAQGVRHRSENERGTIAEKLRRAPELLAEAIESAANFARSVESGEQPDQKGFVFAMGILNAAAQQEETPQAPEEIELAQIQAQIVANDLERTTRLANHLEAMIFAGVENHVNRHVNRKGEATVTPMRPDSLAKLGNLYLGALNVRANRAGIATSISERRDVESASSIGELFTAKLREINHRTPQGHLFADIVDSKPLTALEAKAEEDAPKIVYMRRRDESEAEMIEGELLEDGQN